ncbi:MAG: DUF4167 domain-containing protein [Alphaproteobacteria bacterium]|nr:DUF4167 domain-containing protein [Alphaproteobacteria bacterium]
MRVSNTPKRHRSRNNNPRRNNSSQKNNPYNNKDTKIKGNAIQVHEKYQSLARDAITAGDIIKAEYYFQHAEHYHRVHKLSQNNQIEKKQKNVVKIYNEELNSEKNKDKLEEKTDISSKEDNLTKSDNKEVKTNTEESNINK